MPVLIAQNIAVSHDTKESHKRHYSRKQSRLTYYLTTVDEEEKEDISIFNETCVQNVLEVQQERKKKRQRFEKLNLVWKRSYNRGKTPQEALDEFLAIRNAPRRRLRLNAVHNRIKSYRSDGHEVHVRHTSSHQTVATGSSTGNITDSGNCKSEWSGQTRSKPKATIQKTLSNRESPQYGRFTNDHESPFVAKIEEDTSSVYLQSCLNGRRVSRNIFNTKKATDHQEHNMFPYRPELKRTIVKETITNDSKKKKNSVKRKSSLFDALMAVQHEKERLVPEIKNKVGVDTILRAYLSEQFLDLNLQGPEAADLRDMYTATILRQPVVNNLIMKHPDMLSSKIFKDLVTFKKGFEVNPIYSTTIIKSNEGPWRQMCNKAFATPCGSVLIELENDVPEYANFYKNLLQRRAETVRAEETWLKDRKPHVIRNNLLHLSVKLRIARQNPGSSVRFDMLRIFAAAARNERLLRQLSLSIEGWLDQLVKGLYSPFKSVREETCQVLCLMTASYPVMRELYLSKYFDVIQDLSLAIFRAIDQYEDTFPEYYILLAHIIHYSPSRSTMECILDRWTNFRCVGLILQWPRLLYYALRYWPDDVISVGSRLFGARVTKTLDIALQRPLTSKACRRAAYYLQVRLNVISHLFTINYDMETSQSSFIAALNE